MPARTIAAIFIIASALALSPAPVAAEPAPPREAMKESKAKFDARMKWWREARFGMFVHWGPVSLKGTEIGWSRGDPVPKNEYDNLYRQFNPAGFDANQWADIAKSAGMRYMVLTAKHHDGFCLWDTKTTPYNIMSTPFKRDVVKELAAACKREGITFCTYYSILDWYHPDYNTSSHGGPGYGLSEGQKPDMNRYEAYMKTQLRELVSGRGPLGVLWFDGEWEAPWTHERGEALYTYVRALQPSIIINNRVDKGRHGMQGGTKDTAVYRGDFDTPEQQVGKFQTDRPWETCMTLCTQWAWKPNDQMKSLKECLRILMNTVGGDGNLLLNVGPMPDGRIEPRQAERLKEIGDWLKTFGESVYGTRGGPFKPGPWGVSTHKGKRIYVHVLQWPGEKLDLPGMPRKIVSSSAMNGGKASVTQSGESVVISMPEAARDPVNTVIVLDLDGPISAE